MSAGFPRPYGRYVLEERIAMGGMAEIFRARTATQGFDKRVCIKRILPHFLEDEAFVSMFRDEARTAGKLQHANVVQVFDFGEEEGTLFLAMELVDGADLRRVADTARKKMVALEVGEVVQIGIDVCRGLHHAHTLTEDGRALGIVHRDISPHNILLSRAGEVKVTDFGIAKAAERSTHTGTGIVKGKVAYMSPEQAEGLAFDHRLDQFAVGVVLWELLTGTRLFLADGEAATLRKVLACEVPPPSSMRSDVPAALDEIVLRALARDAHARFADMRAFELALSRFLYSGAIDPSSADLRSLFSRVMDGVTPQRKTKVANADEARRDIEEAERRAAARDLPPASATQTQSDPARLQASTTDHDQPMSASSDVSRVFSSSDKQPAAPRPGATGRAIALRTADDVIVAEPISTPAAAPVSNPLARAMRQSGAQPAAANVPTLLEDDPQQVARATQSPPPERSAMTKSDSGLSLSQAAAEVGAAPASALVDDGTPATRTHVPRAGEPASLVPGAPSITSTERLPGRRGDRERTKRRAALLAVPLLLGAAALAAWALRTPPNPPLVVAVADAGLALAPPIPPAPMPAPPPPEPTPVAAPPDAGTPHAGTPQQPADRVGSDEDARTPVVKRTGWLLFDLAAASPWVSVRVDGKERGEVTDREALVLPVGVHRVVLENKAAGFKKDFRVEVVAGQRRLYGASTGKFLGVK